MSPAPCRRTASRSRLLIRLRLTAFPFLRETVRPTRGIPASSRSDASTSTNAPRTFVPRRTARNSERLRKTPYGLLARWSSRPAFLAGSVIASVAVGQSGRKALAAACAACGENLAAADCRHARTETVTALADQFGRLIGAFHCPFRPAGRPLSSSLSVGNLVSRACAIKMRRRRRARALRAYDPNGPPSQCPPANAGRSGRSRARERKHPAGNACADQWFVNCSLPR